MSYEQLELFPVSDIDMLRSDINSLKKEVGNLRRGLFSRHTELASEIVRLRNDIDMILSQQNVESNLEQVK